MSERPGFFFFVCPDARLLRYDMDARLREWRLNDAGAERLAFWGDEDLPPRFWEALTMQGFLPVLRVLVLRNAHNLPAETWKKLSRALGKPNPQAMALLCLEGGWERGQPKPPAHLAKLPCLAYARKAGWYLQTPGLDQRGVAAHVRRLARSLNLQLEPGALEALVAALPPDAAAIEAELEKAALYAASRTAPGKPLLLTAADTALVGRTPDFNIFALIRHLQAGNALAMWTALLREGDDLLFPLLGLLQREARMLWQTLHNDPAIAPRDAQARGPVARQLGAAGLAALWDAMHQAEWTVKTGRLTPGQALDGLAGELTLLFAPPRRR